MRTMLLALLITCILSGCNSIRSVADQPLFASIIGNSVTTREDLLLVRLHDPWRFAPDIPFQIYEGDSDRHNAWNRLEADLPAGTELRILEVNRYVTHEGGAWIGVVGMAPTPNGHVKFIYMWPSSGYALERAPWEGMETAERRPLEALH